jgi:hypothetical protein
VVHTFLLEAGNWNLEGYWLKKNEQPIDVKGQIWISWKQENWFTMTTNLAFADGSEVQSKHRGHLDDQEKYYTYVLKHSILGNIEGEGWIGPQSIIQCYWIVGATQRRTGFDTFYRKNENTYQFSSGILAGHHLSSTMEAILKRQG